MTVTKWDGVSNSTPTAGTLGTAGSTLCLFACVNVNQDHDNYAKMLCYGFRATDAGVLRLNLLPAKKTEGGTTTYGLYDTVANEFRVSGNSKYPLSAAAAVVNALDECSEAFVFENDTIWRHFDHRAPMYLRMGGNMRLEHQDIIETTLNR
jgi:hypothetical protein